MTETERDRIAGIIGYQMARLVSRNPMPDMSGDPRRRIPEHERHRFDAACIAAADDILASLRSPPGEGWGTPPRCYECDTLLTFVCPHCNDLERPGRLKENLAGRDKFIVDKGLWDEFVDSLDAAPSASPPVGGEKDALEALRLILPLAKGYAAEHPVGSNGRYVEVAEAALAVSPIEKGSGS